jgi:hypothetical protein
MPRMTLIVALAAFAFVVIGLVVHQRNAADRARQHWTTVEGRVVESRVETRVEPGADRPGTRYGARVVYAYRVRDRELRGERIRFGGTLWRVDPAAAERDLAPYPLGGTVTVHHDPKRPEESVLEVDR